MKKPVSTTCLALFLIFAAQTFSTAFAQDHGAVSDSIYSNVLREERSLKVLLPESYKPGSTDKYEVIYVTDGEWAMDPFSFVHKWAQGEGFVPPAIIVAIPNRYINGANQRDRDFLPVHVPENEISGGAANFLSFIKNELIPYIAAKYPANGTSSIYGHSYGGLFALYALLSEPQLFESYYSTDPPFRWNNDYLVKMASEKLNGLPPGKVLWIAGRSDNGDIGHLDSLLQSQAPKTLHWKVTTYQNETHNSVRLKAMYDGIKFAYSGYSKESIMFHPMNGILLKDKPTRIFVVGSHPELRYTVNGMDPDSTSPIVDQSITITGPAQLVVKSFSLTGKYDKTARGSFPLGEPLPPVSRPGKLLSGGLRYSYYEGDWATIPDFKTLQPSKTGIADSTFNANELPRKTSFACVFDGFLETVNDGYYIFVLVSSDGSRLFLGGSLIIDNDGVHSPQSAKTFILPLKKGFYPFRVEYVQKNAGGVFQLLYVNTETVNNPSAIPLKYQYHGM
ncbi:MAG TPA: alpha/beta hydrolase-fold protein [Bacteroidota bacterium]|nr:alpha/beta hydrolase-fold protein [Bacteroidota bacterium]